MKSELSLHAVREEFSAWRVGTLGTAADGGPERPTRYWASREAVFLSALSIQRLREMLRYEQQREFGS